LEEKLTFAGHWQATCDPWYARIHWDIIFLGKRWFLY